MADQFKYAIDNRQKSLMDQRQMERYQDEQNV
jgi:3-mercaptopyruvate sulfurtransferase SseA